MQMTIMLETTLQKQIVLPVQHDRLIVHEHQQFGVDIRHKARVGHVHALDLPKEEHNPSLQWLAAGPVWAADQCPC